MILDRSGIVWQRCGEEDHRRITMHKAASQSWSHCGDAGLICFQASRRAQMENNLPFILVFSFGQSIRVLSSSALVWSVRVTSQAETPHLHSLSLWTP